MWWQFCGLVIITQPCLEMKMAYILVIFFSLTFRIVHWFKLLNMLIYYNVALSIVWQASPEIISFSLLCERGNLLHIWIYFNFNLWMKDMFLIFSRSIKYVWMLLNRFFSFLPVILSSKWHNFFHFFDKLGGSWSCWNFGVCEDLHWECCWKFSRSRMHHK